MKFTPLFLVFALTFPVFAEQKQQDDSLIETQNILKNASERSKIMQNDPNAKKADDQVKALAGNPENTEEIYKLAAEVMGNLSEQADRDPAKMEEILQKAMQNPEGFASSFSPEQRKKLHDLGQKIEGQRKSTP